MFTKRTGFLAASLALGWWLCATATAPAQYWQKPPCATPYPPPCVSPYQPAVPPPAVKPPEPTPPDQPRPDQPRPDQPRPDQPQPNQPQPNQPQPDTSQANQAANTGDLGSGSGGPSGGQAGLQGRGDANNRFNLFDNMTAIPRNQVWFGWQVLDGFNTNVNANQRSNFLGAQAFGHHRIEYLYRVGAEVALSERFSFAAETHYIASAQTIDKSDAWGAPEFMLKYALVLDCDRAVSAILGFQPQISNSPGELKEETSRIYPGMLFYRSLNDNLFVQGGFQFGLNTANLAQTFDYAIGLGYWLYRDQDGGCDCGGRGRFVSGVVPQIEFYGKNIMVGSQHLAFDLPTSPAAGSSSFGFHEDRNVYDLTVGARIFFGQRVSLGLAYSFPLTGTEVRNNEFISTLNIGF